MPDRGALRSRIGKCAMRAVLIAGLAGSGAGAAEKSFRLIVAAPLAESGALDYLAPRFALKTGVRPVIEVAGAKPTGDLLILDETAAARLAADDARPVMRRESGAIYVAILREDGEGAAHAARFRDWLLSDIGRKAIRSFAVDGRNPFVPAEAEEETVAAIVFEGDERLGAKVSLRKCGRCHVIDERNRFGGIGSTPSFGALRALPKWDERFAAFWTLNPHPAFTQIEEMTETFHPARPSPIAPMRLTMEEVEAIQAFVAEMAPKDLGAPLAID